MDPFKIHTKKTWLLNSHSIKYISPYTKEEILFMHVPGNLKYAMYLRDRLNAAYNQGAMNTLIGNKR